MFIKFGRFLFILVYIINELDTSLDPVDPRNSFWARIWKLSRCSTGSRIQTTRLDLWTSLDHLVSPHGSRSCAVQIGPNDILGPTGSQHLVVTSVCSFQKSQTRPCNYHSPMGLNIHDNQTTWVSGKTSVSVSCVGVICGISERESGLSTPFDRARRQCVRSLNAAGD